MAIISIISIVWFYMFTAYVTASSKKVPLIESLPNAAFSSSTDHGDSTCASYNARRSSPSAWCALTSSIADEYLQVDLGQFYRIGSVSVYPRKTVQWSDQYVKTYTLSYSSGGSSWTDYSDSDGNKILTGPQQANTGVDENDEVNAALDPVIESARYLKFTPLTYNSHKSMRVEAYAVEAPECVFGSGVCPLWRSIVESNVDGIEALNTRVAIVDDTLDQEIRDGDYALGVRIDNLVTKFHDMSALFGGEGINHSKNAFDDSLFVFSKTELLLLCVNILTIVIGLCICWRGGLFSKNNGGYVKVGRYYETDVESKPINS